MNGGNMKDTVDDGMGIEGTLDSMAKEQTHEEIEPTTALMNHKKDTNPNSIHYKSNDSKE